MRLAAYFALNSGRSTGVSSQTPAAWPAPTPSKKSRHPVEAIAWLPSAALMTRARVPAPAGPISGRAEIRLVKYSAGIALRLGVLHHRRGADGQIRAELARPPAISCSRLARYWTRGPVRLEPFAVGIGPDRPRAGGADIGHIRAAFDQQPRDQQFGAFIARNGDPALDRFGGERAAIAGRKRFLAASTLSCAMPQAAPIASSQAAVPSAPDRRRADDLAARGFELAHAGGVEGVDRRHHRAIERRIELAPFAGRARPGRPRGPAAPASGRCPAGRPGTSRPAESPSAGRSVPWVRRPGPASASLRA